MSSGNGEDYLPLIYFSGFIVLILGITGVLFHSIWVLDWRLLVTIIVWLTLVKGLMRIFFPMRIIELMKWAADHPRCIIINLTTFLLIGLYLIYVGFQFDFLG